MMKRRKVWLILAFILLLSVTSFGVALAEGETGGWALPIDLTPILQAVIGLLASIITVRIVPWIKARTSAQQQELLTTTVRILVYAAEQIYGSDAGQDKLNYVKNELMRRGFTVDTDAIEAAVREMSMSGQFIAELQGAAEISSGHSTD